MILFNFCSQCEKVLRFDSVTDEGWTFKCDDGHQVVYTDAEIEALMETQGMKPIEAKAIQLVESGRVTIRWQNSDGSAAHGIVDGDTDTYQSSYSPEGYVCTCAAARHHRNCSHALAVELMVAWASLAV